MRLLFESGSYSRAALISVFTIVSILTTCSLMMFCRFLETCRTLWRFCQASVSSFMLLRQIISSIFSSAQNCQFSKHKNEHTASKSKMREHNNTKQFGPFFNVVVGLLHMRVEDFFLSSLFYVCFFLHFKDLGGSNFTQVTALPLLLHSPFDCC